MSRDESARLVHRMHAAFNARDIAAIDEIFAADFYSHPLRGGVDALKAAWLAVARAHPAAHSVVEDVLVDGDRVADRVTTLGITDEGSPATILEVFYIADGRIAELWAASTSKPPASRGAAADDR